MYYCIDIMKDPSSFHQKLLLLARLNFTKNIFKELKTDHYTIHITLCFYNLRNLIDVAFSMLCILTKIFLPCIGYDEYYT